MEEDLLEAEVHEDQSGVNENGLEAEVHEDQNGITHGVNENGLEAEVHEDKNGITPEVNENGLTLTPVSQEASGEGLPYAPENWPNPGDIWTWKVGRRVATTGHFVDRYLYPPRRIVGSWRGRLCLPSKLSVERFVKTTDPKADVGAFFASFSWKIPAKKSYIPNGIRKRTPPSTLLSTEKKKRPSPAADLQTNIVGCKAGNENCSSLLVAENPSLFKLMSCDICCNEPRFCRACCCILCCKTIDPTEGAYSYIKCEKMVSDGYICGHIAHINCGLRSYMAGTVGGSIGLDAEYFCRRCDARTDLVPHVRCMLHSCESSSSCDDIVRILGIGVSILRGSRKSKAIELLRRSESIISELKNGTSLEDIWKMEENVSSISADISDHAGTDIRASHETLGSIMSSEWNMSTPFDHRTESLKLEDEIDQVLLALRKSQELEYKLAEEKLQSQKKYLQCLFQQLEEEQREVALRTLLTEQEALPDAVSDRVDQIKREVKKLKRIGKVGDGFGRTRKVILKEDFGLDVEVEDEE